MIRLLSALAGFVPSAHANQPALTQWGAGNSGVQSMWTTISNTVYVNIPAQDIVHALTGGIVQLIFTFIGGAAAMLIMYAGIRMIASRGKDDEFTQGKTIITWAVIGLVLAMIANAVISFFAEGFLPTFLN
jgi:uncharacterized membrane-anchored protein